MERLMSTLTQSSLAENLSQASRRLRTLLSGLEPRVHTNSSYVTREEMHELLSELLHAGQWLRLEATVQRSPELEAALTEYRATVQQLRDLLPFIQGQLLAERARLEAKRTRVESATEWARASQQTL
jgi:hypothetical protein